MAEVFGDDFVLEVETAVAGTYIPVANMNRYSSSDSYSNRAYHRFGASRLEVAGDNEQSFTVSGYLDNTDAGQARLVAMKEAKTPARVRVKADGTNGFTQQVLVLEDSHDADADPETIQDRSFRFRGIGARTKVGTGGGLMS